MPNQTTNYKLNQWEPEDDFLRTDFNEDNAKIDAALGEKSGLVFGSYAGDGTTERTFNLGFQPKAVYICTQGGMAGDSESTKYIYGGLALPALPLRRFSTTDTAAAITTNGFTIYVPSDYVRINRSNEVYYYVAVR